MVFLSTIFLLRAKPRWRHHSAGIGTTNIKKEWLKTQRSHLARRCRFVVEYLLLALLLCSCGAAPGPQIAKIQSTPEIPAEDGVIVYTIDYQNTHKTSSFNNVTLEITYDSDLILTNETALQATAVDDVKRKVIWNVADLKAGQSADTISAKFIVANGISKDKYQLELSVEIKGYDEQGVLISGRQSLSVFIAGRPTPTPLPTSTSVPTSLPTATSEPTPLPTLTPAPTLISTATPTPTSLLAQTSGPAPIPTSILETMPSPMPTFAPEQQASSAHFSDIAVALIALASIIITACMTYLLTWLRHASSTPTDGSSTFSQLAAKLPRVTSSGTNPNSAGSHVSGGLQKRTAGASNAAQNDAQDDMEEIAALRAQIKAKQRRLRRRKMQEAELGNNVDPAILIEIEDLDQAIAELERKIRELGG